MLPFELDRDSGTPGAYPLVLVSYLIACTITTPLAKPLTIKGIRAST